MKNTQRLAYFDQLSSNVVQSSEMIEIIWLTFGFKRWVNIQNLFWVSQNFGWDSIKTSQPFSIAQIEMSVCINTDKTRTLIKITIIML